LHRRRDRQLRRHDAHRNRARCLHRQGDRSRRLPPDPGRRRRHELLHRHRQPTVLAAALSPRRAPLFPLTDARRGAPTMALSTTSRPPVTEGTVLLAAHGVTKTFTSTDGPKAVLEGIDLEVRAGEIVALLGKSGSGKSTLLRCFAGLIAPSTGT